MIKKKMSKIIASTLFAITVLSSTITLAIDPPLPELPTRNLQPPIIIAEDDIDPPLPTFETIINELIKL